MGNSCESSCSGCKGTGTEKGPGRRRRAGHQPLCRAAWQNRSPRSVPPILPPRRVPSAGSGGEPDRTLGPAGGLFTAVIRNPRGSFPSSFTGPHARDTWSSVLVSCQTLLGSSKGCRRPIKHSHGLGRERVAWPARFLPSSSSIPGCEREIDWLRGLRDVLVTFSSWGAGRRGRVTAEQLRTRADADGLQIGRQAAADPTVRLVQGPVAQFVLSGFLSVCASVLCHWGSLVIIGQSGRAAPSSAYVAGQCAPFCLPLP